MVVQPSKTTLICVCCGGAVEVPSYRRLPDFINEHRMKHLAELRAQTSTVTVLFGADPDSHDWLILLMAWDRMRRGELKPADGTGEQGSVNVDPG